MINVFQNKIEVLNHWIAFADGIQVSPLDFYASLETELSARKVPSMDISRVEFAEGGLLSEKRIYLRMLRERLVFDVCAAPFGAGFFFSCRMSEIRPSVQIGEVIALLAVLGVVGLVTLFVLMHFAGLLGFIIWFGGWLACAFAVVVVLTNVENAGVNDLDGMLLRAPLIGSIYGAWFRPETYHRIDSRLCYLEIVQIVVKRLAEEAVAAKGVKLVRQYELAPILGGTYKRSTPELPPEANAVPPPVGP